MATDSRRLEADFQIVRMQQFSVRGWSFSIYLLSRRGGKFFAKIQKNWVKSLSVLI